MKLVADEGIDRQIVLRLRDEGHEVLYVAELQAGITDDEVLGLAAEDASLLITADKDFGDLVFRQHRSSGGVLLIRLSELRREQEVETVVLAIRNHGETLLRSFSVVTPGRVRIRSEPAE